MNKALFDEVLLPPKLIIVAKMVDSWGQCLTERSYSKSHPVTFTFSNEIDERDFFIQILAHEMVHQWEQQIYGRMTHGKVFFSWKPTLNRMGIALEESY